MLEPKDVCFFVGFEVSSDSVQVQRYIVAIDY